MYNTVIVKILYMVHRMLTFINKCCCILSVEYVSIDTVSLHSV